MKDRKPYIALLMSILAPGLGHIYYGKVVKGILLLGFAHIYFPLVIIMGIASEKGPYYFFILMAAFIFSSLIMLYAIGDTVFLIRRKMKHVNPGKLNRPWVYVLIIIISLTASWLFPMNIRNYHVQAFRIPAGSMIPSLLIGDYVFADKAVYKERLPRRGEIVVFIPPKDHKKYFIKRVIGLPGDLIEIRGEDVILNGTPLAIGLETNAEFQGNKEIIKGNVVSESLDDISYHILLVESKQTNQHQGPFTVPQGHCFVMGDNRYNSHDSRHFGPVAFQNVIGRVNFIYCPARSWSRFGKIN
jgi:signal peptidase I